MKSVAIVDDHLALADSLGHELVRREIALVSLIDPAHPDALQILAEAKPDGCLIDLDLGEHSAGGLRFLRQAVSLGFPSVMFTGSDDDVQLGRCLEEGAIGIILKSLPFAEVAERVRRLLDGEPVNNDTELLGWVLAAQAFRKSRARELEAFDLLTARERAVLQHMMDGMRADGISEADHVSVATVRSQVRAVLQKLGVNSQIAAIALAYRAQWSESSNEPK